MIQSEKPKRPCENDISVIVWDCKMLILAEDLKLVAFQREKQF